jgi:hypothetical protein
MIGIYYIGGMRMIHRRWETEELGRNSDKDLKPNYTVHPGGEVDINPVSGTTDQRVNLTLLGMYNLTHDWLKVQPRLDETERAQLIDLISTYGKKTYNPRTKEWE